MVLVILAHSLHPQSLSVPSIATVSQEASDDEFLVFLPVVQTPFRVFLPFVNSSIGLTAIQPANADEDVSANAYLVWSVEDTSQSYRFDVYLDANTDTPISQIATELVNPWFDPPTYEPGVDYSWQVVAINTATNVRYPGPVWRFGTEPYSNLPDLAQMVYIPGGEFWMGCDRQNPYEYQCSYNIFHYDEPVRRVQIDTFEIDKYEVTNQEYLECMNAGVCSAPRVTDMLYRDSYALAPVLYVSWWDAQDYCAWEGKRLPTEAEWEKAARGVIDTRRWPWGNEDPDCSQASHNGLNRDGICPTAPARTGIQLVGMRPRGASPYGVHDMAGNAFEWVQDKYDVYYYLYSPLDNPQGPPTSRITRDRGSPTRPLGYEQMGVPVFTIRGGSYTDNRHYMRVVHRHWGHHGEDSSNHDSPFFRNIRVGFRCARSLE
jgi:formylglycine-generating enzyme required for sulfatase activity